MAAASYYNVTPEPKPGNAIPDFQYYDAPKPSAPYSPPQHSPLRPMLLVETHHGSSDSFHALEEHQETEVVKEDLVLKARIRHLRFITRVLACMVSIAVFIPITLTFHIFLTTKDTFREVPGPDGTMVSRTPWHKDSKTWPTYMYFVVAAIALVLNIAILISYCFGIKSANKAAKVSTFFSGAVMIGNLVVWSVAASLYRTEKNKNGDPNDLWGWTCSASAREIQHIFRDDVNFDQFCQTQSASWYAGLVQVGVGLLSAVTFLLVLRRRKVKKVVQRGEERLLSNRDSYGQAN